MMKFFRRILWGCESPTRTFVCREEAAAKKLAAGGSIAKKAEREPEADQEPAREDATDRRAAKKAEHEPAADQEPAREDATDRSAAKKAEHEPAADQEPAREVVTDRRAAKKAENNPEADQDVADETQKSARKFSQKLCEIRERVRLLVNLSEIRGVLKLRMDLREIRERVWLRGMLRKAKGIYYIGGSDVLPEPLDSEEERRCLAAYAAGSDEARSMLIEHNLRLVVYIAKKFENSGVNVEDLISIGTIGLIKAVNTFKTDKNIKLATYASRCIENEILMYLRRSTKLKSEVSLDEPLNVDWDGNELLLSDILGTEHDTVSQHLEEEVNRSLLYSAMAKLTPRERELMEMRFGLKNGREMTQKEVADKLGISQSYISRLEKRIITRLQREMRKLG